MQKIKLDGIFVPVITVANVFSRMCTVLYEEFRKGDCEKASELQGRIIYLNDVFVKKRHNQLSAIKEH